MQMNQAAGSRQPAVQSSCTCCTLRSESESRDGSQKDSRKTRRMQNEAHECPKAKPYIVEQAVTGRAKVAHTEDSNMGND